MFKKIDENSVVEKFIVDSCPDRYLTGIIPSANQIIMGILLPNIWIYTFDNAGFPIQRNRYPLSYLPPQIDGIYRIYNKEAEDGLSKCLNDLANSIELIIKNIEIREFFDDDNYVGITRYSSEIENFIENKEELDEEEQIQMAEQLEEWNKNGYAVMCWCEEYTINNQGKVIDS
jgi:hypothetical protein